MSKNPARGAALLVAAMLIATSILSVAGSSVFDKLTVQGQLRNSTSDAVSGYFNMSFNIYDVDTGGAPLYQKNVTGVYVDSNGIYSMTLDNIDIPFSSNYYLGIFVDDDSEMSPRLNITDASTVFRSNSTENLGSMPLSHFLNTSSEPKVVGGNLTIIDSLFMYRAP